MSLEDLRKYILVQEAGISKLSVLDPKGGSSVQWIPFRDHFWGKPMNTFPFEELVDRDVKPIKAVPANPPITRAVVIVPPTVPLPLNINLRKILVRSEYKEAEEAAVSANRPDTDTFVVCGQPGIGKSVFLLYLLMRRLALELPTVLQFNASYAVLFHKGGVTQLKNIDDPDKYLPICFPPGEFSHRIWVLIDINPNLPQPAPAFRYNSYFFAVSSISPGSMNTEWLDKLYEKRFYMKPWSNLEVIQGRHFLGGTICSERQLFYLFHQYGASTRALAHYGTHPELYVAELQRDIEGIQPEELPHIFRNPESSENSHCIIAIHPGEASRDESVTTFASRRVFDMVWEKHLARRLDLMEELYYLLLAAPITVTSAGWVFEDRMHQVLRAEGILRLFPIHPRRGKTGIIFDNYAASKVRSSLREFQLASSEEHPLVEGAELVMNRYYRLESSDFAAVNSVLLIRPPGGSPILFVFQMTRNNTKHDLHDLQKVSGLGVPPGTRRYLVIVTPEDIHPSITVPLEYFGETVPISSEETDSDENEGTIKDEDGSMDEDQDEAMDEDQGEEEGKGQCDAMEGAEWALFRVFHCPIDIGRLLNPVKR